MPTIDEQQIREAVKAVAKDAAKEAMAEFLNAKFAAFGKWSLAGIGAMFLVAIIYFVALMNGWHR